ncbi:MAG TPA: hypothetical protein VI461_00040 [Chitinophagaceae bacterium]|nr:hypothetical protein [Chitinophagaceae bacterium]
MRDSLNSIRIFGAYSLVMGLVLFFIPHRILPLFNISMVGEDWIKLLGFVLICSSYYYIRSAYRGNIDFAVYTIHTRLAAPVVILLLYLTGSIDKSFLPFGLVDGLGGLWTLYAYQKEKQRVTNGTQ